jgi:predicted HD phosphohydrolase
MSNVVSFVNMKEGTQADYEMLHGLEADFNQGTARRLLRELASQAEETLSGYQVTRMEHALQSATHAHLDGADIDWVVGALLHDIGDGLSPLNHDRFAAEILRPFVREEVTWVVENHGVFQMYYYAHHFGRDQNARDRHTAHPSFQAAVDFCERWDQNCFNPAFESKPLSFFEPMVEEVFARKAYDPAVTQAGIVKGLPALN